MKINGCTWCKEWKRQLDSAHRGAASLGSCRDMHLLQEDGGWLQCLLAMLKMGPHKTPSGVCDLDLGIVCNAVFFCSDFTTRMDAAEQAEWEKTVKVAQAVRNEKWAHDGTQRTSATDAGQSTEALRGLLLAAARYGGRMPGGSAVAAQLAAAAAAVVESVARGPLRTDWKETAQRLELLGDANQCVAGGNRWRHRGRAPDW